MFSRLILLFCLCSTAAFAQMETLYVMTVPKSGTHMAMKLMTLLRTQGGLTMKNRFVHYYMSEQNHRGIDLIDKSEFKKMTLIRDLRDVAVSLVHFLNDLGPGQRFLKDKVDTDYYYGLATISEKLTFLLTPNNTYYNFLLKNFEGCLMALRNPDILVLRFEELVGSKGGGSDELQRESIQAVVDFMGFQMSEDAYAKIQEELFGNTRTFRKGQIGSWKEEFNEQQVLLFEQSFGRYNRELGYW